MTYLFHVLLEGRTEKAVMKEGPVRACQTIEEVTERQSVDSHMEKDYVWVFHISFLLLAH